MAQALSTCRADEVLDCHRHMRRPAGRAVGELLGLDVCKLEIKRLLALVLICNINDLKKIGNEKTRFLGQKTCSVFFEILKKSFSF